MSHEILRQYSEKYKVVKSIEGENVSRVWLVQTPDGEKRVLKQYPEWFLPNDARFIQEFVEFQLENGLNTHIIYPANNGEQFIFDEGNLYCLQGFVSGENYRLSSETNYNMGSLLAQLHNISAKYSPKLQRDWWNISSYPAEEYFAKIDVMTKGGFGYLQHDLNTLKSGWEDALSRIGNSHRLNRKIVIHGDFQPKNMRFASGSIGILDFDNCREEIIEMDFARILRFFLKEESKWKEQLTNFMDGYFSLATTPKLRPSLLSACMVIQPAREAMWQLMSLLRTEEPLHAKTMKRDTGFLENVLPKLDTIDKFLEEIIET